MHLYFVVLLFSMEYFFIYGSKVAHSSASTKTISAFAGTTNQNMIPTNTDLTCSCAVFLTGQIVKGSSKPPSGYPPITADPDETFACSPAGVKQCTTKCLESLVHHLPTSSSIICAAVDRDVFRERAYLYVKNCNSSWISTHMSAGREYCCKNNEFYKCPNVAP